MDLSTTPDARTPGSAEGGPADLVFLSGPVHTVDSARTRASAVAVRGDRILAVGHEEEIRALIGPATEVVDLHGKLLIPGFQDAHVHPVGGGRELALCDLSAAVTAEAYRELISAYAAAHPQTPWITGGGWSMEAFPGGMPTREFLDSLVPDRPVFLVNRDHHGGWANSCALERAGLTDRTPDPSDGRIERDADGKPTGMLQEGAMQLVAGLIPDPTVAEQTEGLLRAQRLLHGYGVTAWQDAMLGYAPGMPDVTPAYVAARRDGKLTARVTGALWWDRARGEEQIPELIARRAELTEGRLRATSVKIMQDGIAENHTAAMLTPYLTACGCASDNSGISFIDPEALRSYVTQLDAEGFQVHFHALGDRAVREALDAVEAARRTNGLRDTRPHLAHLQVVHPEDVPRFHAARRDREHPGAVGGPRAADGRADHSLPGAPARRLAVPVRRSAALGRHPGGGQRLAGQLPRPDRRAACRGQPPCAGGPAVGAGLPARAAHRPGCGARRVHGKQRLRQPPRRDRHHPARQAGRPGRARPRSVRRPRRGDRLDPCAADVRRGTAGVRGR